MKNLKRILLIIHQYNSSILPVSLLYAACSALLPFVGLLFSAQILNQLIAKEFMHALYLAGFMLGLQFFIGLLRDFLSMKVQTYADHMYYYTENLITDKILDLDYASISTHDTQEALRMATEAVRQRGGLAYMLDIFSLFSTNLVTIITSCALVLTLCLQRPEQGPLATLAAAPSTLLLAVLVLTVLMVVNYRFRKKDRQIRTQHMEESFRADITFHYYTNTIYTNPQSHKTIQMNHMGPMMFRRLKEDQIDSSEIFTMTFPQERKMAGIDSLFSALVMLFSYGLVVLKIMAGAISVGNLLQYTGAISQFSSGFLQLIANREELTIYLHSLTYLLDFWDLKNKFDTGSIPVEKRLDNVYELEFHDVSFAYPGSNVPVLEHVSCKLNLKQKMAVVGPNGAGKSTFIKLLCRLYDPTSGMITLNGVDIRKYDYREYMSLFGVVFQDFVLFPYSVAENVSVSMQPDAARVWECLRMVEMEERLRALPRGIDTPMFSHGEEDDGVNFSGGEQQKIAIARALYKDAPLVILDEPTAALDPISEYEIYSHFDTLVKDKTSIFISHRMSSCRFCEDIMVFDKGRIVQRGSHEELLADASGLYADLWHAQAQYYEAEN